MSRSSARKPPAYKTLAGELRSQIRSGALPPTRRLPTDAELSEQFAVSRQTVRHAFNELVAEGLVYRVPGRGSFAVASTGSDQYLRSLGSIDDLLALSVDSVLEVIQPLAPVVDLAAAGRLRLAADVVSFGEFRRLHGALPFSLTKVYLPPDVGRRIAGDARIETVGTKSPITIIQLIEETSDSPLVAAHQSTTAALADADTADLIGCGEGQPVLCIDRMYSDANGRIVELATSVFNVSRYSYRIELRRGML